ncbi:hypothetical protein KY311_00415, partial [Candidatus Woesearchaeota archaeon]|nr:hypothetical protein [Candidatus Woesearchaeota archaeon]
MIIYSNITGCYVFDESGKVADKADFSPEQALEISKQLEKGEWIQAEKDFGKKYPESFFLGFKKEKLEGVKITMDPKKFSMVTDAMLKNWEKVKEYNTIATKLLVKESVHNDSLIIQSTNQLDEVNKVINILAKRLREWYELYNPEFSKSIQSHEKFAELILQKPKTELLASLGIK